MPHKCLVYSWMVFFYLISFFIYPSFRFHSPTQKGCTFQLIKKEQICYGYHHFLVWCMEALTYNDVKPIRQVLRYISYLASTPQHRKVANSCFCGNVCYWNGLKGLRMIWHLLSIKKADFSNLILNSSHYRFSSFVSFLFTVHRLHAQWHMRPHFHHLEIFKN